MEASTSFFFQKFISVNKLHKWARWYCSSKIL